MHWVSANLQFSSRNRLQAICESFIPQKKPAIQYSVTYLCGGDGVGTELGSSAILSLVGYELSMALPGLLSQLLWMAGENIRMTTTSGSLVSGREFQNHDADGMIYPFYNNSI